MDKIEEYGLDTPPKILPILLFMVAGGAYRAHFNRLQINKMVRYFEFLIKKNEISFSNYNLGGVSYELTETLGELVDYGLLDQDEQDRYFMSKEGQQAGEELYKNFPKADCKLLEESCTTLMDLTNDELLFFMYKTIPKTQEKSTVFDKLMKNSVRLVQNIYNKGKISASIALSWVGEDDKDELDLELNPEYVVRIKAKKRERTIRASIPKSS